MRVLICDRLLRDGPASGEVVDRLTEALVAQGHQVEAVLIPISEDPAHAAMALMAMSLMTLQDRCDQLICLGAPLHLIRHTRKTIWSLSEPDSMAISKQDTDPWLRSALRVGFGQALRLFAPTADRTAWIAEHGFRAGLLPLPNGRDIAKGKQWRAVTEELLLADMMSLSA